jgi:hypothetical protein
MAFLLANIEFGAEFLCDTKWLFAARTSHAPKRSQFGGFGRSAQRLIVM